MAHHSGFRLSALIAIVNVDDDDENSSQSRSLTAWEKVTALSLALVRRL